MNWSDMTDARLVKIWLNLRASYYFIPALMGFGAFILALVMTAVDKAYSAPITDALGWFYSATPASARAILTTIAGSMISVAAVTFSLTMVAVTSAAGQYGPRLIGNFMRDRTNQISLGTFIATFIYALVVLRAVVNPAQPGDVEEAIGLTPSLSVLGAIGLTVLSIGVLIRFMHHIPETLNVGNLTGRVAKQMSAEIEAGVFPTSADLDSCDGATEGDPFEDADTHIIRADSPGYIQTMTLRRLVKWGQSNHLKIRLCARPGDFVTFGDALLEILMDHPDQDPPEEAGETIQEFIAIGRERTAHQNILFLADELVEIAARALSPGVNDPFTAINCIHWYGSVCAQMMRAPTPPHILCDSDGVPRLWADPVESERLLTVLFGQSRPYICEDANASRVALKTLYGLQAIATDKHRLLINHEIEKLQSAIAKSSMNPVHKDQLARGRTLRP